MATPGNPGPPPVVNPPDPPPLIPTWKSNKGRSYLLFVVCLALLALMGQAALKLSPGPNFAGAALLLVGVVFLFGQWSCRRPLGVLIDYRNLMSLARFQCILWTIIVLAGFLAMVALRLRFIQEQGAMNIAIPPELWALMGISTASLVGAPMILQNKIDKTPTNDAMQKASETLDKSSFSAMSNVNSMGTLYRNGSIQDARITDMLQGDEISNIAYLDMAKVQMLLFTIVGALVYCGALYNALVVHSADTLSTMPALSQGMVTLLGISHAGYLTSKTVDRTPTT